MDKSMLTKKTLQVNSADEFDTLSLDTCDPISQYTIVPNELIRDKNISPQCRWLIIFLISNKPGWVIKTRQICEHTKGFIGRDSVRRILNEAIENGYIRRDLIAKITPKGNLRGYVYVVSSTPKFKKCLRQTGFQYTEDQCTEPQGPGNQGTKELLSKELLSKDTSLKVPEPPKEAKASEMDSLSLSKPQREKPEFTPKVRDLGNQMLNSLTRTKPDYLPPKNMMGFLTEVDFLLRIDRRDPQKVIDVFNWALADSFWVAKMFKPNPAKYLREKYDQLEITMNTKPNDPNKVDRRTRDINGNPVLTPHLDGLF